VKTENLTFNNSSQGEVVEELGELLPDIRIAILTEALIVETITKSRLKKR